jgi:hypothetical protein
MATRWSLDEMSEVEEIARVVGEALALGLFPALLLCVAVGFSFTARAHKRVAEVNERGQRIVAGNLRERLPHRNTDDPFSKRAIMVHARRDGNSHPLPCGRRQ